jgi:choline dehydrogenase-like flavoprotein
LKDNHRTHAINHLAGASGCVVASRLANSASKPSVLLLECGGLNDNPADLLAEARFTVAFDPESGLNWNYKTTPQNQLVGQEVDYSRGKGLGGTTAINFCAWTVGPKDDYDEWARLVGNEKFAWTNVTKCLNRIENLHPEIPRSDMKKYLDAKVEGMLFVTYYCLLNLNNPRLLLFSYYYYIVNMFDLYTNICPRS